MKKAIVNLLFVLFLIPVATQAKVWRVNNNAGVVADFTTLDGAIAAYSAGDSIYLEPSATPYTVSFDEFNTANGLVTIIGNGYNLADNTGLQQNPLSSNINSLNSNGISIKKNIKLVGIVFNDKINFTQDISGTDDILLNVSFESCLFTKREGISLSGTWSNTVSGITFIKSFFTNGFLFQNSSASIIAGFAFENNIVNIQLGDKAGLLFAYPTVPAYQNVVRNNIFLDGDRLADPKFSYCYVANNIFNTTGGSEADHCVLKNNLYKMEIGYYYSTITENNLYSVDMSTVFQSTLTDKDNYFQLKAGSPAIGAGVPNGVNPVDCGAFGGPNPYKLSGIPAMPSIYELEVPLTVKSGANMRIKLKSKSNN